MNKQEEKQINEETAKAEASLIINEAMETGENFPHFLIGWMMGSNYADMAQAAEAWIETNGYEPEEN